MKIDDIESAREFWLDIATPYGDPCDFIDVKPHDNPSASNVHVIRMSEYEALQVELERSRERTVFAFEKADKLEAEVERLREALEYYAKGDANPNEPGRKEFGCGCCAGTVSAEGDNDFDRDVIGLTARQALEQRE